MHICLDFRPALRQGTGVGTYIQNLVVALSKAFPEDRHTAFSASWKDRLSTVGADRVKISDWKIPVRGLDWCWHRLTWPNIEQFVGSVDIAHSPSPMLLPARRAKTIVSVFDCHFIRHPDDVFGPVQRDYVPLARRSTQRADAVAVGSSSAADEVRELLGVPEERIHITPLGVHNVFFEEPGTTEAALRSAHRLDAPFLLFVGRRERRKDLGTLFLAVEEILEGGCDVQLVVAGPDAPGWEQTWAAAPETVRRSTRLIPYLPAPDLAALYAAAEIAVMSSRWEGFGLTGLEAMATGTPVVASRVGSLPEVLGDAALFAEPGTPAELAHQCRRLLEDPELATSMTEKGRDHAAGFRWSDTARLTRELYGQLAG